ncbi:MAG: hypothetical protein R6V59_03155 [Dehalococcoidia bacterium]
MHQKIILVLFSPTIKQNRAGELTPALFAAKKQQPSKRAVHIAAILGTAVSLYAISLQSSTP